ncbi:hypothetical protein [Nonlabens marinus]|uniref:Uncharacterized protein n=1 Tax=Nonlabens marinus S1-08 TaxID=1454201 RepID=W8VQP0_9FLAO|nr:hypothetical protein [Nonlabens marinus]BAO55789.1 hypothetical protein NMS_1780 [Nonlabens marinus S1-08]
MSCILRVSGEKFKVDEFLSFSKLNAYSIRRIGEKRDPRMKLDSEFHETSGFQLEVSNADYNDFDRQKADAVNFLKQNYKYLSTISTYGMHTGKEDSIYLDFAIENLYPDFYIQTKFLEPELLQLAGNLNIEIALSLYEPDSDEEE